MGDIDVTRQFGTNRPLGIEGLAFEGGFVSISEAEWRERFPLVLGPDGDEVWDYGDSASEHMLDAQDEECIWTLHHDSGEGMGDFIASGRWRVNRLGYYVSSIPVPAGLRIQVWDDVWGNGGEEIIRKAVPEWQAEFGVDADSIVPDEFQVWFEKRHREHAGLVDVDLNNLMCGRLGLDTFVSLGEYYDIQLAMGDPSRSRYGLVRRALPDAASETLDVAIADFLADADNIWLFTSNDEEVSGYRLERLISDRCFELKVPPGTCRTYYIEEVDACLLRHEF